MHPTPKEAKIQKNLQLLWKPMAKQQHTTPERDGSAGKGNGVRVGRSKLKPWTLHCKFREPNSFTCVIAHMHDHCTHPINVNSTMLNHHVPALKFLCYLMKEKINFPFLCLKGSLDSDRGTCGCGWVCVTHVQILSFEYQNENSVVKCEHFPNLFHLKYFCCPFFSLFIIILSSSLTSSSVI